MVLLIDGYNVLKRSGHGDVISAEERGAFLDLVDRYLALKKHEGAVFFDGGESSLPTHWRWSERLVVHYAGNQKSADDLLLDALAEAERDRYLLVSSDRELIDAAEARGIASLGAEDFYQRAGEVVRSAVPQGNRFAGGAVKRAGCMGSPELDALLAGCRVSGAKDQKDEQRASPKRRPEEGGGKKTKTERRLEKIARKL